MNRKLVLLFGICLFLAAFWAGVTTFTQSENVVIHQSVDKVAPLLTHLDQWARWHPDFANQKAASAVLKPGKDQLVKLDDFTYLIQTINPVKVYVYKIRGSDSSEAILSASPYKDGSYTYVEYTTQQSGFARFRHLFAGSNTQSPLVNLQRFAEDDSRRYGFYIRMMPVTDTIILTTGITTTRDSLLKATAVLYNRLADYCKQNFIPVKSYYYTSAIVVANDKLQVSAGMPVPKQTADAQRDFEFLRLPATGHLVAGNFTGKYKDRQQLYAAMDEYVQDKHMKKVAQPLEKYEAANSPLSDSTVISMQLFYPVF